MIYSKDNIFKMIEENAYFDIKEKKFYFLYFYNTNSGNIDPFTEKSFEYKEKRNVIKVKDENGKTNFVNSLGTRGFQANSLRELKDNFWNEIKDGWIKTENAHYKILYLKPMENNHPDYILVKDYQSENKS